MFLHRNTVDFDLQKTPPPQYSGLNLLQDSFKCEFS